MQPLNCKDFKLFFNFAILAPFQEQGAQLLEFNGPDVQGNTVMMGQQGSPMVIGGRNPPQSGLMALYIHGMLTCTNMYKPVKMLYKKTSTDK